VTKFFAFLSWTFTAKLGIPYISKSILVFDERFLGRIAKV